MYICICTGCKVLGGIYAGHRNTVTNDLLDGLHPKAPCQARNPWNLTQLRNKTPQPDIRGSWEMSHPIPMLAFCRCDIRNC